MKTLNTLSLGQMGKIQELHCSPNLKRRLLDLGFIPGSIVFPVYRSTFGNPIAYRIRGITIAIRNQDANQIILQ